MYVSVYIRMNVFHCCVHVLMQVARMSYVQIYESYFEKLVKCLPMDDAHFITNLYGNQLLPGDTQDKLNSLSTQANKALYFLNHVIKPALDFDNTTGFTRLLSAMKACDYDHVQTLYHEINDKVAKKVRKSDI